jgi:hypothetical protein
MAGVTNLLRVRRKQFLRMALLKRERSQLNAE